MTVVRDSEMFELYCCFQTQNSSNSRESRKYKSARREHLVSEKLVRDWRKKMVDLNALLKRADRSVLEYICIITTAWYRTRCAATYIPVIIYIYLNLTFQFGPQCNLYSRKYGI